MGLLQSIGAWLRPVRVEDFLEEDDDEEEEEQPLQTSSVRRRSNQTMTVYQAPDSHEDAWAQDIETTAGAHGKMTDRIIWGVGIIGTPILWFVLGLGNAQLFSGFRPLTISDPINVLMYVSGFAYEAFGIACILLAGKSYAEKKWPRFAGVLSISIFMSLASLLAQYMLIESEVLLQQQAHNVAGIAVANQWFYLVRSLVPIVLEFAIVFLFAERQTDALETLKKQQKVQHEYAILQQGRAALRQMHATQEMTASLMEQTTQAALQRIETYNKYNTVVQPPTNTVYIEREAPPPVPPVRQPPPVAKPPKTPAPDAQPIVTRTPLPPIRTRQTPPNVVPLRTAADAPTTRLPFGEDVAQ